MNPNHRKILEKDFKEVGSLSMKLIVSGKLFYYFFQRPIANFVIKKFLKKKLKKDVVFNQIDKFLLNEGGMFKKYIYGICNKFYPLKRSKILVPGIGYGRNLFQLASFQPKLIVCFDIYEYSEEWSFLQKEIYKKFKVPVIFYKGSFEKLPRVLKNSFDFIISDAVLEHVKDLWKFGENSREFLRNQGYFYASFGPLWYGPRGDHIYWGKERIFDHLILSEERYKEKFKQKFYNLEENSTYGGFMVKNKLFSYLSIKEYFEILSKLGFKKLLTFAKISTEAIFLLKKKKAIRKQLDEKGVPSFDRFCSGIYLWMKLNK